MQAQRFLLSQLTTDTPRQAAICVRVVRKWVFDANKQNGPALRIDLVLADKEVICCLNLNTLSVLCCATTPQCSTSFVHINYPINCFVNCLLLNNNFSFIGLYQGNAIYAEIPQQHINSKAHLLDMDHVYVISRFLVRRSKETYRPVNGHHMIEFTAFTLVNPANDPPNLFPSIVYDIKLFHEIQTVGTAALNHVGRFTHNIQISLT